MSHECHAIRATKEMPISVFLLCKCFLCCVRYLSSTFSPPFCFWRFTTMSGRSAGSSTQMFGGGSGWRCDPKQIAAPARPKLVLDATAKTVLVGFFFPTAWAYRCERHSGDKSAEPLHRGPGARVSPLCRGFPVLARVTYRPIHWPAEGFRQAPPAPAVAPFPKALRPAHQLSDQTSPLSRR